MNRFKLIQRNLLEFNQIAMANAHGSEAMLNRVMTKDNIGLAAILEFLPQPQQAQSQQRQNPRKIVMKLNQPGSQPSQHQILVCNTHIHWDPEYCDVKLIQTIMLMNELQCIAKHHRKSQIQQRQHLSELACDLEIDSRRATLNNNNLNYQTANTDNDGLLPLVLLGDFNSIPSSGVTTYLTSGKINSLHKDFKSFKYTSCANALAIHENYTNSLLASSINPNSELTNGLRRQSSPAWCFYSPSSSPTSTSTSSSCTSTRGSSDSGVSLTDELSKLSLASETHQQQPVFDYDHPFKLASAYGKETMPYTNYTLKFKAIIDYIFYSQNSLQLIGLLGPLDKGWLKGNRIRGFPQPHLPSDHLPLFVKFKLTPQGGDSDHHNHHTTSSVSSKAQTSFIHRNGQSNFGSEAKVDCPRFGGQSEQTGARKQTIGFNSHHKTILKHEQNRS